MPSTYVLIEQSEFHDFIHDLETLHSWARKMAGLSTSITVAAPLQTVPATRPDEGSWQRARPIPSSPFFRMPDSSYSSTLQSPAINQDSPRPDHAHCGIGQGKRHGGLGLFGRLPSMKGAPEMPIRDHERIMGRPRCEPCAMPMWQAPVKAGPHRTPNVTRAPSVPHMPQRGVRYVRRPRRVRLERDARDVEAIHDEAEGTEDEEYVVEEDDDADVDERETR